MIQTFEIGFFTWDNEVATYTAHARSSEQATANFWDWLQASDFPVSTEYPCLLYVLTADEMAEIA